MTNLVVPLAGRVSVTPGAADAADAAAAAQDPAVPTATGALSCVVDADPRFHLEVMRWFATTTGIAGVAPGELVVHLVDGAQGSVDVADHLRGRGVTVVEVPPFDGRSPHCNKISGALQLGRMVDAGRCVLTDSDVVVFEDPRTIAVPPDQVAMKPVDMANPPLEVLRSVFSAAGVAEPATIPLAWQAGEQTFAGNGNGGLYIVPAPILPDVAQAWARWARWLLDRLSLLQQWTIHVDQVSMALALAAEGIGVFTLEPRWNMPVHVDEMTPGDAPAPAVVHYHGRLDHIGQIRTTGAPAVDERINQANRSMAGAWQDGFPNATFWNWRYQVNPELGSGVGSRGQALEDKRALLGSVLHMVRPSSVLDVGCGDGEATRGLPLPGYVGLDLSSRSLERASSGRPDGRYLLGGLDEHEVSADLAICLDVLIHQPDPARYRQQVARLLASGRQALLVSGYEQPFTATSPMVFFHEPLSTTIARADPTAEIYPVRYDQEITTLLVVRPPVSPHPRDFGAPTLRAVVGRHSNPLRLCDLRFSARRSVRFYPDHAPRLWEYPAVADLIESWARPGATVIDVGAGVTPLAPYLAERGFVVDTLDPSPIRRTWPPQPDWNEWDFVDYAGAGLVRASWNCPVGGIPPGERYDVAYSVSVVEHLPAGDRRQLLGELVARMNPGGLLVLTVDLVRDRDDLWNRNRGEPVEDPALHGSFATLLDEVGQAGMTVLGSDAVRGWGDVPVDIGLVVATRVDA